MKKFIMILVFSVIGIETSHACCIGSINDVLAFGSEKDKMTGITPNSNNQYEYTATSGSSVDVKWKDSVPETVIRACEKNEYRSGLENEISELDKIYKSNEPDIYILRKGVLDVLNRNVVPSLGVIEIKFKPSEKSASKMDSSIELKTSCGYSLEYNLDSQKVVVSGRRLKEGLKLIDSDSP